MSNQKSPNEILNGYKMVFALRIIPGPSCSSQLPKEKDFCSSLADREVIKMALLSRSPKDKLQQDGKVSAF